MNFLSDGLLLYISNQGWTVKLRWQLLCTKPKCFISFYCGLEFVIVLDSVCNAKERVELAKGQHLEQKCSCFYSENINYEEMFLKQKKKEIPKVLIYSVLCFEDQMFQKVRPLNCYYYCHFRKELWENTWPCAWKRSKYAKVSPEAELQ